MDGWIVFIIMLIPVIYLAYKYRDKQILDRTERNALDTEVATLQAQKDTLNADIQKLRRDTDEERKRYADAIRDKTEELDEYFADQLQAREEELEDDVAIRKTALENAFKLRANELSRQLDIEEQHTENQISELKRELEDTATITAAQREEYESQLEQAKQKFENIQRTLQQYELEKQQRLYYTIQLPDEFKDDIEFLLTAVAAKVQHPDIISKLVWAEYVKPNLDNTFKRIEIRPDPGIYKITNIDTNKCYIGKSTNVKTRIADHFKSSIGIRAIADQAVHHAILKEGFWNWTIEVVAYCEKEQLSELEKYYIEFFKAQEWGYNKNSGGGG